MISYAVTIWLLFADQVQSTNDLECSTSYNRCFNPVKNRHASNSFQTSENQSVCLAGTFHPRARMKL